MRKTLFTKFSRERSPEYQIMTRIQEEDGVRTVEKCAVTAESAAHVNRMEELSRDLSDLYRESGLKVCPCVKKEDGVVEFPYLTSYSLEQAISEVKQFGDMKLLYEFLYRVLRTQQGIGSFEATDQFHRVFGKPELPENLFAVSVSNIDMIAGNILRAQDGTWYLVDYEWVFPFPIPIEFIYARSIFLQEKACSLPDEQQNELYAIAGIKPGQIDTYFSMEVAFQEYVAGEHEMYSLGKIHSALHRDVYTLDYYEPNRVYHSILLKQLMPEVKELGYASSAEHCTSVTFNLKEAAEDAELELTISGQGGVIQIQALTGELEGEFCFLDFASNAELVIYDSYYFTQTPVLKFRNQGYRSLCLSYRFYWSEDGAASEMVRLIQAEAVYRDKEAAAAEKARQAESEIQRLKQEKQALEAELEAMRQRKVVQFADKVHHVLKKEK